MKIKLKLSILCLSVISILMCLSSCTEKTKQPSQPPVADTTGISSSGTMRFEGVLVSVPSPAQVASLIQKQKIAFNDKHLNSIQNRSKYLNQTKKALNLGVYGTDLAYLSNYEMGQIINDYFDVIASLSSDLGILDNIDKKLVTRLGNNLDNRDSILVLNGELYLAGDHYLKANNKPQISSMILIGGWIESIFITCSEAPANQELRNRLAEQKYAAQNMSMLVEKMDDPVFSPLKSDLITLCNQLQSLESNYEYKQPITDKREKITYLRSQSSVMMTDEQLAQILEQIQKIRNFIIE